MQNDKNLWFRHENDQPSQKEHAVPLYVLLDLRWSNQGKGRLQKANLIEIDVLLLLLFVNAIQLLFGDIFDKEMENETKQQQQQQQRESILATSIEDFEGLVVILLMKSKHGVLPR
ncbi:unnamed protein product [Gongylonema pulchrum]|uniref:DUF21 domain-containing protein n=1 Tax=Gongylonema pulchrum TaxID=637853 RepID=A0A183E0J3_9BILA|nr:unnamed protein product [Gongylonema pulchrum]